MSCHIEDSYSYGSGEYGNYSVPTPDTVINSYARVTNISGKILTLANIENCGLLPFQANVYVLMHISATTSTSNFAARGQWRTNYISAYDTANSKVTLKKSFSSALAGYDLNTVTIQLITMPHFKTLTIPVSTSITCPQFDASSRTGGIVAFRATHLKFSGGHIDVAGKGLPNTTFWANNDMDGEASYNNLVRKSAGWENFKAKTHVPINYPDGAIWFAVEKMTLNADSRIGNPAVDGTARNRGAAKNPGALVGGSSIFIAAKEISSFKAKCIAKYCSATSGSNNKGAARCYIATESVLPTDEGLYAYDKISNSNRLADSCNVNGFYDGTVAYNNTATQLNSYAVVKKITLGDDSTTLQIAVKNNKGKTTFGKDKLVMVHLTHKKNASKGDMEQTGRFWLSKITGIITNTDGTLDKIILDSKIPFTNDLLTNYYIQVVTVTRLRTFTLAQANTGTLKFTIDGSYAYGGIFAVAVNDTFNLSGGQINVEDKGGALPYGSAGLNVIGNAQMCDRLPIGQGHGSVFILAKNLIMDTNTRIGATYSGMPLGGYAYKLNDNKKLDTAKQYEADQKFMRLSSTYLDAPDSYGGVNGGYGGANGGGLTDEDAVTEKRGGYGSNSGGSDKGAAQGAHVFIVADTITGFNINAISTGGAPGIKSFGSITTREQYNSAEPGGAGYGGAGGAGWFYRSYQGGNGGFIGGGAGSGTASRYFCGGGSGAFCFVYCNNAVSQNKTGITSYSTQA